MWNVIFEELNNDTRIVSFSVEKSACLSIGQNLLKRKAKKLVLNLKVMADLRINAGATTWALYRLRQCRI